MYSQGSWNQYPMDSVGLLSFGEVKMYTQIVDCLGLAPITPSLFKHQLHNTTKYNFYLKYTIHSIFKIKSINDSHFIKK